MDVKNNNTFTETTTQESFEELLKQGIGKPVRFNPGEKVEALVTQITKEWIFVDVGGKSDGSLVVNECMDDEGRLTVKEGDKITVYFLSSRQNDMLFTTRITGDTAGDEHLEEAYRSGIPVEGRVEREIKGGFEIKIGANTRAFCPHSQMGLYRVEDRGQYIGQHVTFKIIEFKSRGRNVVVSNRAILEAERQQQKAALRGSLEEGMTVSGEITSIHKFGAFVDIGGLEGLIPVSEISWGHVEDVSSCLSAGQRVDVAIKKLDWQEDKFSFSLKDVLPDPWDNAGLKYPEGSMHTGKVSRLAPFGAFVTLEPGIDGLVHISELGKGKRINHPREVLAHDETVEVKIARMDKKQRRLSLALVSDDKDGEGMDDYRKHLAGRAEKASGALGTLGDILRKKMEEKKT
jgi:small subunit ribosomal protein S1